MKYLQIYVTQSRHMGFPGGSAGKESAPQCGRPRFDPWVGKIPCRRDRLPSMVFWPGELHGRRSPWGRKEWDTTERLSLRSAPRSPLSPSVTFPGARPDLPSRAPPLLQPPGLLPSAPASPPRGPGTPFPPPLELTAFLLHLPTWSPAPDSLRAPTRPSSLPSNSGYSLLSLTP